MGSSSVILLFLTFTIVLIKLILPSLECAINTDKSTKAIVKSNSDNIAF